MKKLLIVFLLVGVAGFSPNSKVPRYFIGQATIETKATTHNICNVIRAVDIKDADIAFRRWINNDKRFKGSKLPKTNTPKAFGNTYTLWEIDWDNVLTK